MSTGLPAITDSVERRAYRERLDVFFAARDEGYRLTCEALRRGIRLEEVAECAEAVARFADEALEIVRDAYRPPIKCAEGCAYCCRKPGVLVSVPELVRIVTHLEAELDDEALACLRRRTNEYVAALGGGDFNASTARSIPCPLLVDDRCSVYPIRPLVCRGYNSTSVEACRLAHEEPMRTVPIFAVLKDVTDGASVGMTQGTAGAGCSDALVDLGTALAIALNGDGNTVAAALQPGGVFAPAENRSWGAELWNAVCQVARSVGVAVPPVPERPDTPPADGDD
jgi:Fe-S-cluster containining protein